MKAQFGKFFFAASCYFLTVSAVAAKLSHKDAYFSVPAPNEPSHLFLIAFGFLIFFIVYQLPIARKLTHFRPR